MCGEYSSAMSSNNICRPISQQPNGCFERSKSFSWYASFDPVEDFLTYILTAFDKKFVSNVYAHNAGNIDDMTIIFFVCFL